MVTRSYFFIAFVGRLTNNMIRENSCNSWPTNKKIFHRSGRLQRADLLTFTVAIVGRLTNNMIRENSCNSWPTNKKISHRSDRRSVPTG